MKLAIMQPYFFPYIGYFSLLEYADEFILFDTAQYDRKGWMNRNRVLKPTDGWQYIRAGVVKPAFRATIKDVQVAQDDWQHVLFRQLEHYKTAPYYAQAIACIEAGVKKPATTLTHLNKQTLEAVRDYLDIHCPIRIFSEMGLELGPVEHAGQWALRITEAVGGGEYVNPPGAAREIFDPQDFNEAGIKLVILENRLPAYDQHRPSFENGLSIIDLMMFCAKDEIKAMLNEFKTEEA
ncbi:MAG: WbqC family protein [Kiritimatiellales bacterium]|nr:WbqC family protein [Pontiella sp.]NNJ71120.1 WbqC family protein [Kiritimatiellales bacterium]